MLLVSKGSIEQNNDLQTSNVSPCFITSCVGRWERKTHVPRGAGSAKSANSRSPAQNTTRNLSESVGRVLAFPAWRIGSGVCHVAPGQESGCFLPPVCEFSTVIFQTKPQGPSSNISRPINRNSIAKEEEEPISKMMFKKLAVATREFLVGGL